MKILLIDDDRDVLFALRDMLVVHSHEVDCVDNAPEAVALVEKVLYDFVFVDYKMPEHDGFWFMRNAKLTPQTKVLLITAYANKDVINTMFVLGASGYITKPFDKEEVLRHLAHHAG